MKYFIFLLVFILFFIPTIANATIVIVGIPTSTNQAFGSASITVSYPAGSTVGDVAYTYIHATNTVTITGTKSWTTVGHTASTSSGWEGYILRRVLDGTEGGTETFTVSGANNVLMTQMRVYSGVNTATPEDTSGGNPNTAVGSTGQPSVTGMTTSQSSDYLLFFASTQAGSRSYGTPSGYGNALVTNTATETLGGWDEFQSAAGATGGVTTSGGTSGDSWAALLVALQPALPITEPNAATTSVGTAATNVPTGVANGDLLVAGCSGPAGDIKITGWTDVPHCGISASGDPKLSVNYRIASSEPASYQFANLASTSFCWIQDFKGVKTTNPIDISNITSGSGANPTAPSILTTYINDWLINQFSECGTFTSGVSGETQRAANTTCSSQWGAWVGDKALSSPGFTGTQAMTVSTFPTWNGCSMAIVPAISPTPPPPTPQTYYIAPVSGGGSDSNNGTDAGHPWLTPNHGINCGDQILAAAGTYNEANFRPGNWGTVTCAANNNVAWLKCAAFDTCKINIATAGHDAMTVTQSYWGVQGWEVTANSQPSTNQCFEAYPPDSATTIHHIIFANNIANGCGDGGITTGSSTTTVGVDYVAILGNAVYNAAQDNAHCYSGIDIVTPINSDTFPGTHIYIAGNYSWGNVDPNPCQGGSPTDGEGILIDTVNGNGTSYSGQIVIENNIAVFNGGPGIQAFQNTGGSPNAPIYIKNNTTYGNQTGSINASPCAELNINYSLSTQATNNLVQTAASTACLVSSVSQPLYALAVVGGDITDQLTNNFIYSAVGNNTSGTGSSFSGNLTGTSPNFFNPVKPSAPSCGSSASVPACMAPIVANYMPTNTTSQAYGYQAPSSNVYDPLFSQWLCGVTNLPPSLIQMGCNILQSEIIGFINRPLSTNHIYSMSASGTSVVQLTHGTTETGPLQYTRDGTKITYATNDGFIHTMNSDGTNNVTLANSSAGADIFPSWSPDNTKIIFTVITTPGPPVQTAIDIMNANGSGETGILPQIGSLNADPQISPDGTAVVMESTYPNDSTHPFSLFTCSLASCSTTFTNLTLIATPPAQYADPNWSPDGTKVSMSGSDSSGNVNVFIINFAGIGNVGTRFTQLTNYVCPAEAGDADWSPSGLQLAYEYDVNTISPPACIGENNNSVPTFVYTSNIDGSASQSTGQNCSNIGCSPRWGNPPTLAPTVLENVIANQPPPSGPGIPNPPTLNNPQVIQPGSVYGGHTISGTCASSDNAAIISAASAGDIDIKPNTCVELDGQATGIALTNRNILCENPSLPPTLGNATAIIKVPTAPTALGGNWSVFQQWNGGTLYGCEVQMYHYPNVTWTADTGGNEAFIINNNGANSNLHVYANDFNGAPGFIGVISITQPNYSNWLAGQFDKNDLISYNRFSHCNLRTTEIDYCQGCQSTHNIVTDCTEVPELQDSRETGLTVLYDSNTYNEDSNLVQAGGTGQFNFAVGGGDTCHTPGGGFPCTGSNPSADYSGVTFSNNSIISSINFWMVESYSCVSSGDQIINAVYRGNTCGPSCTLPGGNVTILCPPGNSNVNSWGAGSTQ